MKLHFVSLCASSQAFPKPLTSGGDCLYFVKSVINVDRRRTRAGVWGEMGKEGRGKGRDIFGARGRVERVEGIRKSGRGATVVRGRGRRCRDEWRHGGMV